MHLVFAKLDEKVALSGGAVHLVSGERQAASQSRRPQVSVGRTHQPESEINHTKIVKNHLKSV